MIEMNNIWLGEAFVGAMQIKPPLGFASLSVHCEIIACKEMNSFFVL